MTNCILHHPADATARWDDTEVCLSFVDGKKKKRNAEVKQTTRFFKGTRPVSPSNPSRVGSYLARNVDYIWVGSFSWLIEKSRSYSINCALGFLSRLLFHNGAELNRISVEKSNIGSLWNYSKLNRLLCASAAEGGGLVADGNLEAIRRYIRQNESKPLSVIEDLKKENNDKQSLFETSIRLAASVSLTWIWSI